MAKTAKPKNRQISTHSRAARRAASPSLDAPTAAKPTPHTRTSTSPDPTTAKPHVLAAQHSSGISKRAQKSKPLKRAQRLRQLKGAERAEENLDKLQHKVAKSVGREKRVRERAKGWDDINEAKVKAKKKKNAFDALGGEEEGEEKKAREWGGDEAMDGAAEDGVNGDAGVEVAEAFKPLAESGVSGSFPVSELGVEVPNKQALPLQDGFDPDL
ncbi:hypothetical protein SLS60_003630 [Paraconiothyrium brasiliense]|uniref:Alb1-domain-containing protein n=1 Tax=Paraconiothyrium brasiliense TaxID=300254 RepID=A0ABR3RPL8_9PLEO